MIDYRIEKLRFLKDSYRDVFLKSKLFSDKFMKFITKHEIISKTISPRKYRPVKKPKVIKIERNPREKKKPPVPRFSRQ